MDAASELWNWLRLIWCLMWERLYIISWRGAAFARSKNKNTEYLVEFDFWTDFKNRVCSKYHIQFYFSFLSFFFFQNTVYMLTMPRVWHYLVTWLVIQLLSNLLSLNINIKRPSWFLSFDKEQRPTWFSLKLMNFVSPSLELRRTVQLLKLAYKQRYGVYTISISFRKKKALTLKYK